MKIHVKVTYEYDGVDRCYESTRDTHEFPSEENFDNFERSCFQELNLVLETVRTNLPKDY